MTQRTLNLYSYPLAARCNRAEPAEREKGEGPWFDLILSAETFYTAEVADKVSKARRYGPWECVRPAMYMHEVCDTHSTHQ